MTMMMVMMNDHIPKMKEFRYLVQRSGICFFVWGDYMNSSPQPIMVTAGNIGVCCTVYQNCIRDKMISMHKLSKFLQVSHFSFLL